ncbi:MAG TPA: multidrug ABC transporter ATP-binding protein, partial [Chloroflexota bacterium]|nr:multidrug ABC transporter ATP-binding protein [Chloroflexota bacterium]
TRLLAINTPEQLAAAVWGRRTAIELDAVSDAIVAAVQQRNPTHLEVDWNRLLVELADPDKEIPDLVQAIVAAGGRIRNVEKLEPDLEETYLRIVKEQA